MKFLSPRSFKKPGFSLIEAMLVMGMAGIFLTIITPAIQTFNRNQALKSNAVTLKNNLRLAQDNTFSGRRQDAGGGCPSSESLLGWYVYFSSSAGSNNRYELRGLCSSGTAFSGNDFKLSQGVTISEIRKISPLPQSTPSPIFTLFQSSQNNVGYYSAIGPPYPGTVIAATEVRIRLQLSSTNHYVYINSSGEIYDKRT